MSGLLGSFMLQNHCLHLNLASSPIPRHRRLVAPKSLCRQRQCCVPRALCGCQRIGLGRPSCMALYSRSTRLSAPLGNQSHGTDCSQGQHRKRPGFIARARRRDQADPAEDQTAGQQGGYDGPQQGDFVDAEEGYGGPQQGDFVEADFFDPAEASMDDPQYDPPGDLNDLEQVSERLRSKRGEVEVDDADEEDDPEEIARKEMSVNGYDLYSYMQDAVEDMKADLRGDEPDPPIGAFRGPAMFGADTGYTPFEFVTFTDTEVTHSVSVHVDAPVSKCFAFWMDRLNYLHWFDLIGQMVIHKQDPSLVSLFLFYRWAQMPLLELYTTLKRTEIVPDQRIVEESVDGMEFIGAAMFAADEEDGGTNVTFNCGYFLPWNLKEFVGPVGIYGDVDEILVQNMTAFKDYVESTDLAEMEEEKAEDLELLYSTKEPDVIEEVLEESAIADVEHEAEQALEKVAAPAAAAGVSPEVYLERERDVEAAEAMGIPLQEYRARMEELEAEAKEAGLDVHEYTERLLEISQRAEALDISPDEYLEIYERDYEAAQKEGFTSVEEYQAAREACQETGLSMEEFKKELAQFEELEKEAQAAGLSVEQYMASKEVELGAKEAGTSPQEYEEAMLEAQRKAAISLGVTTGEFTEMLMDAVQSWEDRQLEEAEAKEKADTEAGKEPTEAKEEDVQWEDLKEDPLVASFSALVEEELQAIREAKGKGGAEGGAAAAEAGAAAAEAGKGEAAGEAQQPSGEGRATKPRLKRGTGRIRVSKAAPSAAAGEAAASPPEPAAREEEQPAAEPSSEFAAEAPEPSKPAPKRRGRPKKKPQALPGGSRRGIFAAAVSDEFEEEGAGSGQAAGPAAGGGEEQPSAESAASGAAMSAESASGRSADAAEASGGAAAAPSGVEIDAELVDDDEEGEVDWDAEDDEEWGGEDVILEEFQIDDLDEFEFEDDGDDEAGIDDAAEHEEPQGEAEETEDGLPAFAREWVVEDDDDSDWEEDTADEETDESRSSQELDASTGAQPEPEESREELSEKVAKLQQLWSKSPPPPGKGKRKGGKGKR